VAPTAWESGPSAFPRRNPLARGKLRAARTGTCVVCESTFDQRAYQENTCSPPCWIENRRRLWERRRLTEGCARCHVVKPLSEYTSYTTPHCRACFNQDRRARLTAEDYRAQNLKKYRLSPAEFDQLLGLQGGRCAICRTDDPGGRHGSWHVDHDHGCCPGSRTCGQCTRGILCANCNVMIGNGQDNPAVLRSAADYLERPRQPQLFIA
jgi:hypothetical protein